MQNLLKDMTRARLIWAWFTAVTVAILGGVIVGASVTASTVAVLFFVGLAPPAIVLLLWPAVEPVLAEVLRDDRRP